MFRIVEVDPQGADAMALLRLAAIEARALYPEDVTPDTPWPTNPPTPPRGIYLVAHHGSRALGCGALRPLDLDVAELRRMFVRAEARRSGVARALLMALEAQARRFGYRRLVLETGCRQQPAITLYTACGFRRIPAFGPCVDDPLSLCFGKDL